MTVLSRSLWVYTDSTTTLPSASTIASFCTTNNISKVYLQTNVSPNNAIPIAPAVTTYTRAVKAALPAGVKLYATSGFDTWANGGYDAGVYVARTRFMTTAAGGQLFDGVMLDIEPYPFGALWNGAAPSQSQMTDFMVSLQNARGEAQTTAAGYPAWKPKVALASNATYDQYTYTATGKKLTYELYSRIDEADLMCYWNTVANVEYVSGPHITIAATVPAPFSELRISMNCTNDGTPGTYWQYAPGSTTTCKTGVKAAFVADMNTVDAWAQPKTTKFKGMGIYHMGANTLTTPGGKGFSELL